MGFHTMSIWIGYSDSKLCIEKINYGSHDIETVGYRVDGNKIIEIGLARPCAQFMIRFMRSKKPIDSRLSSSSVGKST